MMPDPNVSLCQRIVEGMRYLIPGVVVARIPASLELSQVEEHAVDDEHRCEHCTFGAIDHGVAVSGPSVACGVPSALQGRPSVLQDTPSSPGLAGGTGMTLRGEKPYRIGVAVAGLEWLQKQFRGCLDALEMVVCFRDLVHPGQEWVSLPEPSQWQIQMVCHSGLAAMASNHDPATSSAGNRARMSCRLAIPILGDLECRLPKAEVDALGAGPPGYCDGFP